MITIEKKYWDTFTTPEKMIQKESELLDQYEQNKNESLLRLWESPQDFVVLGISNKAQNEVYTQACEKKQIPIVKRCSGGGTVLQGPGCLNYSFILPQSLHTELTNIQTSNCFMMNYIKKKLEKHIQNIEIKGVSDLVYNQKKFSGNAQRRKKRYLLFHGTILYNFSIDKIETYLKFPTKSPEYRKKKSHVAFCGNIPLTQENLIDALLN